MNAFPVDVDFYHGPLDLLIVLVRQGEVEVLELAIGQITRRYLESPDFGRKPDLDDAGEFLVLVACLMELKSQRLLPHPQEATAEVELDQTRQELVKQLLEYRKFREAAALLAERAEEQRRRLARQADDLGKGIRDPSRQPIRELELWDLVSAFSRLMKENVVPAAEEVERDPTPLPVYMNRLEAAVLSRSGQRLTLRALLGVRNSRAQLIGKFLAVLELIRSGRVWVDFEPQTGEIYFVAPRERPEAADVVMAMADESVPPDAYSRSNPFDKVEGPAAPPIDTADEPEHEENDPWAGFEPID